MNAKRTSSNVAVVIALLLGVGGCSHVDTGQVDYRIAEEPNTRMACVGASCDPQAPAPLIRRYLPNPAGTQQPIGRNHYFSISLEQGAMGNTLLEGVILGQEIGSTVFGDAAEIAILANVFEFGGNEDTASGFINNVSGEIGRSSIVSGQTAPGEDPLSGLRLIYYSGDVEPGQNLNFSNIPLLTVRQYSGRSVGIQIVVVEVDGENGATSALFSRLAEFGQQLGPTSSGVLPILSQLGQSFASGASGDDVLLDYRFVLSANTSADGVPQLTPGRYVLRRQQDRQQPMAWGDLCVDHNTGLLFRRIGEQSRAYSGDNACAPANDEGAQASVASPALFEEVRDEFYMTFRVDDHGENGRPEFVNFENWTSFRDRIATLAEDRTRAFNELFDSANTLISEYRSRRWQTDLQGQWISAAIALARYEALYVSDEQLGIPVTLEGGNRQAEDTLVLTATDLVECGTTTFDVRSDRDTARNRARAELRAFYDLYRSALAEAGQQTDPATDATTTDDENTTSDQLSEDERQSGTDDPVGFLIADRAQTLSTVSRYFIPWSSTQLESQFASIDAFETTFMSGSGPSALVEAALRHAEYRKNEMSLQGCAAIGLSQ